MDLFLEKSDAKLYLVLKLLEKNPKGVTLVQLEKECGKTRKTILKYFDELTFILKDFPNSTIYLEKSKYSIVLSRSNENDFHKIYTVLYERSKKVSIFKQYFLRDSLEIDKLAKKMNCSYSNIWASYKRLETELINYDVILNREEKNTNEEALRIVAYHFFWSLNKGRKWDFSNTCYDSLMKLVEQITDLFGYKISTSLKEKMAYIIATSNERVNIGKQIKRGKTNLFPLVESERQLFLQFISIMKNCSFPLLKESEEINYLFHYFSIEFPELKMIDCNYFIDLWEIENSRIIEILQFSPSFCKAYFYHQILKKNFYQFLTSEKIDVDLHFYDGMYTKKEKNYNECIYYYYKKTQVLSIYFDTDFGMEQEEELCKKIQSMLMVKVNRVDFSDDVDGIDLFVTTQCMEGNKSIYTYVLNDFPSIQQIEKLVFVLGQKIVSQFHLYLNDLDV